MFAVVISALVGTGFVGLRSGSGSGGQEAADTAAAPGTEVAGSNPAPLGHRPTGTPGALPASTVERHGGNQSEASREMGTRLSVAADRCRAARKGLRWYRGWFRYWTHKMGAGVWRPARVDLARSPCPRYLSKVFRAKAQAAREAYGRWVVYHYHWWEWLPLNWQNLGACETGYGRRPGNFEHTNSRFTSAFGISWAVYDSDARAGGAPPWHVRHTPRDQYNAALAHLRMYGDGWTCPGP